MTQQKEKPLNELLTHSIVDIYVGSESTHWPIHEKLLCYYSPFFSSIFYDKKANTRPGQSKSYGLPDEDDRPFEILVGWLYSRTLKAPTEEKDVGPLLDLYLLADKFDMTKLADEVVNTVREFYHTSGTYPGLRRVQYIYNNTGEDNLMREMMVGSIARYLALGDQIPHHWAAALKRNGQLALDIIRSVQEWHLESQAVPDARDASADRGRLANGAFAPVEQERPDDAHHHDDDDANDTTGTPSETAVNGDDTSAQTSVDEGGEEDSEQEAGKRRGGDGNDKFSE